jgi:DNA-binding SARP family transcriptional activator
MAACGEGAMKASLGTTASTPRLALLRGFDLVVGGKSVELAPASERLLAFMGIHDRPLRRTFVSGSLWPDASMERANANLRSALWRVPSIDHEPLVSASATHLCLGQQVDVDYRRATSHASALLHPDVEDGKHGSVELLCNDLLPDWYEDWLVLERERYRQLRLQALDRACDLRIAQGRYGEALEIALSEVTAEPLRETAFRLLVRIHLAEGNFAEAVRQYRLYAEQLNFELGARPSESMRELLDGYLTGERVASTDAASRRRRRTAEPEPCA